MISSACRRAFATAALGMLLACADVHPMADAHPGRDLSQVVPPLGGAQLSAPQAGTSASVSAGQETANGALPAPVTASSMPSCKELGGEMARRWLVFDSDRAAVYNGDLYLVRADGSDLRQLTEGSAVDQEPAFSPDGTQLAFTSTESGSLQIHLLNIASGKRTQLTRLSAPADEPSWSADGKHIVFHSGPSIYIMDANGENIWEIAGGLDDFNAYRHPSLSADGSVVVFDRNNEIDAINVDGTGKRYIVQNWTTTEEAPAISRDGQNVAFSVRCSAPGLQIGVVPFAGYAADPCNVTFATSEPMVSARHPAWGPRDFLAFECSASAGSVSQATEIVITAGPGHEPCLVVGGPFRNHNPSWAPEGFELE
jgi:Tol biopolymer transport system component